MDGYGHLGMCRATAMDKEMENAAMEGLFPPNLPPASKEQRKRLLDSSVHFLFSAFTACYCNQR